MDKTSAFISIIVHSIGITNYLPKTLRNLTLKSGSKENAGTYGGIA